MGLKSAEVVFLHKANIPSGGWVVSVGMSVGEIADNQGRPTNPNRPLAEGVQKKKKGRFVSLKAPLPMTLSAELDENCKCCQMDHSSQLFGFFFVICLQIP
jgi:hypothetical protein